MTPAVELVFSDGSFLFGGDPLVPPNMAVGKRFNVLSLNTESSNFFTNASPASFGATTARNYGISPSCLSIETTWSMTTPHDMEFFTHGHIAD